MTNVAEGTVTVSVKADRYGYETLEADDITLKILPRDVTIQVTDAEKFFDKQDPAFSGTVSGLVKARGYWNCNIFQRKHGGRSW